MTADAQTRREARPPAEPDQFRWLCELIRNGLLVALRGETVPTTRRGYLIIIRGIEARYGLRQKEVPFLDE